MENKPVKYVEFDQINCSVDTKARCPYCGHKHELETEDYSKPDESEIYQCDSCDKYFRQETNYHVSFTTQPLENYYLVEKQRLINIRKQYYGIYNPPDHTKATIAHIDRALEQLEKDRKDYMDLN